MKFRMLCVVIFFIPALAQAVVNTKNGNFAITYADISQNSGGHELNLERTYNSKSLVVGWFGTGWGSPYETRMRVMPDGEVVVIENGSGHVSHYPAKKGGGLQAGVDRILAAAAAHDNLNADELRELREKLLTNEDVRRASVEQFDINTQLPVGGGS